MREIAKVASERSSWTATVTARVLNERNNGPRYFSKCHEIFL
jgi:hypothetical protein